MTAENSLDYLLKQRNQACPEPKPVVQDNANNTKPTIMVVDDELGMRQALKSIFSPSYNVIVAADGDEAVVLFNQHKNISCVVTDALMPKMDGFQTAMSLHQINPDIPIIMLTAHQAMHEPTKVVDFNFKGYVTKGDVIIDSAGRLKLPTIDELEKRVKSACEEYALLLRKKAFFDSLQEERVWLEEKVNERTKELAEANTNLTEALRAKEEAQQRLIQAEKVAAVSSVAYGIGHDFINILDTIQNNFYLLEGVSKDMFMLSEMYKQGVGKDEITAFVEKKKISGRSERISRLCDITRSNLNIGFRRAKFLEHYGKIKDNDSSNLRIEDIVTSVLDIYESKLHTAGVTVHTQFTNTPYQFKSKQDDIYSIFDNVLRNAIEANATRIEIESQVVDGQYTIQVKDNGMGMQEEDKKRVFDLFFSTKKLDGDGRQRGIGLATVLKTVQDYGGKIKLDSIVNQGTTFTVEFKIEH